MAVAADAAGIRQIAEAAYGKYIPRMGRRPVPMDADFETFVERGQARVLEEGGNLVGYIVLIPEDGSMLVQNIAVSPAHQGMDLGRQLLEYAETEARQRSITRMTLFTNVKMTENQTIYRHIGYRETERRTVNGSDRVYMEKNLDVGNPR